MPQTNTQSTPKVTKPEKRKAYHWKVRPSSAEKLTHFAEMNGMFVGAALERAIDRLVEAPRK